MTSSKACATVPLPLTPQRPPAATFLLDSVSSEADRLRLVLAAAKAGGPSGPLSHDVARLCNQAAARLMDGFKYFASQNPTVTEVLALSDTLQPVYMEMLELGGRWAEGQRWHLEYEMRVQRMMITTASHRQVYDAFESLEGGQPKAGLPIPVPGGGAYGANLCEPLISPPQSVKGPSGFSQNNIPPSYVAVLTPPKTYVQPLGQPIQEMDSQVKYKWQRPEEDAPAAHNWRFCTLMATAQRFTITQTFAYGRNAKVRWAIDPMGQIFAVKVFRIGATSGQVVPDKKTLTSSIDRVMAEKERTVLFRNVLDSEVDPAHGLLNDRASLNLFRVGTRPVQVVDAVLSHYSHKAYIVMTAETGDLIHLQAITQNKPDLCLAAARSVATQGYVELQALHEKCHYGHFDISRGNIFFNRLGQFILMDFDSAMPLNEEMESFKSGQRGTLAAPEMVTYSPLSKVRPYLTDATDVFALAALTVQLANPNPYLDNPFEFLDAVQVLSAKDRESYLWDQFGKFEAWKDTLRPHPAAQVDVSRIAPGGPSPFDGFFAPLAQGAPLLCDRLINRAMVADVTQRASAREMATGLLRSTVEVDTDAMARLVDKMAEADDALDLGGLSAAALEYDAWQANLVARLTSTPAGDGASAQPL